MTPPQPTTAVLVEGESDQMALLTLGARHGWDPMAEGAQIVVMGGVTNTRRFARRLGPLGARMRLAGLFDVPDEAKVRRGLAEAGLPQALEQSGLVDLGFFACRVDLEDELVRAVGLEQVLALIDSEGDGHSLRLLAGMPAQEGWPPLDVVRRFLTSQSGRKLRYAQRLAEEMDLERAPEPLTRLIAHVRG